MHTSKACQVTIHFFSISLHNIYVSIILKKLLIISFVNKRNSLTFVSFHLTQKQLSWLRVGKMLDEIRHVFLVIIIASNSNCDWKSSSLRMRKIGGLPRKQHKLYKEPASIALLINNYFQCIDSNELLSKVFKIHWILINRNFR